MERFRPEGDLARAPGNEKEAFIYIESGETAEALCVLCSSAHDLIVDLGFARGTIPRNEGAVGIEEGEVKDIALISRVNKPVQFKVTGYEETSCGRVWLLSRRKAQEQALREYVRELNPGDVIGAKVTHLEPFGAFVDIGCGIPSLIPIDLISVSRISHPKDRFYVGQDIRAAVRTVEGDRVTLTHKELLGTWEQNAAFYSQGQTVTGIVRSIESYGIFVELRPNLAGLAELRSGVSVGSTVSVYIKALIPEKMKIKLIIVDCFDTDSEKKPENEYFIENGRLVSWRYSPEISDKNVVTSFTG